MKRTVAVSFFLFFFAVVNGAQDVDIIPTPKKAKTTSLEIFFSDESTTIDIQDRKFRFSWKTPQGGPQNLAGPGNLLEQGADFELTGDQMSILKDWMEKQSIFKLKGPDSKGDENAPVAAINLCLNVRSGDRAMNLFWTGASRWNNEVDKAGLESAVSELKRICSLFAKDRHE